MIFLAGDQALVLVSWGNTKCLIGFAAAAGDDFTASNGSSNFLDTPYGFLEDQGYDQAGINLHKVDRVKRV